MPSAKPSSAAGGTPVARGKHVVPAGVAVEELRNYDGQGRLVKNCPPAVEDLMNKNDCVDLYRRMAGAVAGEKKTRNALGKWKDEEVVAVVNQFRDEFASKGVKVALCKYKTEWDSYRWFEYIDLEAVGGYVPEYNVEVSVAKGKHAVPAGVAVEEIQNYDGQKKLVNKCPPAVEALMKKNGCLDVYRRMVDAIANEKRTRNALGKWKDEEVVAVVNQFHDEFAGRGVRVALCKYKTDWESYRWFEYIDVEAAEGYVPEHDVETSVARGKHTVPPGVAVEELQKYDGEDRLVKQCPPAVEALMKKNGRLDVYHRMVDTIAGERRTRNVLGKWKDEEVVSIVNQFRDDFASEGVKVSLCKYKTDWESYRWFEFIDLEAVEGYVPEYDVETSVARGKHTVPPGVAVEELQKYDGEDRLVRKCPPAVEALMKKNGCPDVYHRMVDTIAGERKTRNTLGKWKDEQVVAVVNTLRDDFASRGIKVTLCRRSGTGRSFRWFEYVDIEHAGKYVPQYDVTNYSEQMIKTHYKNIRFPNGVAVEQLKEPKRLKEKTPPAVKEMIEKHGLVEEYDKLIDGLAEGAKGVLYSFNWKRVREIGGEHTSNFEEKGVSLYISYVKERKTIPSGQAMQTITMHYCWLEFVDAEEQPNYRRQIE